jgi:glycerol-3-phosphate acyltransferase PlsY
MGIQNFNIIALVIVSSIIGYIFGSIPNAVIIARIKKVDIRNIGSGNPGAGNVAREIGKFWGILVFILDAIKAIIPMLISDKVFHLNSFWTGITGLFAVIGHCYSLFLHFKGGKGAASSGGVMIYLFPKFSIIAILTFLLLQKIPRTLKTFLPIFLIALGLWIWLYWNSMPLFIPFVLIFLTLGILLNIDLIKELIKGGKK